MERVFAVFLALAGAAATFDAAVAGSNPVFC